MPVESVVVAVRPVEQSSEFVAVLKSRTSVTIQPQVEGFLTRIAVASGDRVARGAVLFEVDAALPRAALPRAALRTLESTRALRQTDVDHAQQELTRARTLFGAGAFSQRDLQQAETLQRSTEAALRVVDEQIAQTRTDLSYYRVVAPSAGVIGDVPVRTGDRVTRASTLTVVDDNESLEAYVSVPVQQAAALQGGLPTRIVDDRGTTLASNRVSYVSPTVEPTQTVLAKVALRDGRGQFRAELLVRVQVIWATAPAVTVPLTALSRINGQYFAFVMQPEGQGFIARQQGLTLGALVGNDDIVQSGLAEGDRLITGGIQKIWGRGTGDAGPSRGPGHPRHTGRPWKAGRLTMVTDRFIRRPVLSTVCSRLIILAGAASIPTLPIARSPELAPPAVAVTAFYTGAPNIGGPMVTQSGVLFVGASIDRYFRAFDSSTGALLWETELDAAAHSVPMTFLGKDGRQYVVVAAGGGSFLGSAPGRHIVAFALPRGKS